MVTLRNFASLHLPSHAGQCARLRPCGRYADAQGRAGQHKHSKAKCCASEMIRNGQSTVAGPKWTKMDLFRPKLTKT